MDTEHQMLIVNAVAHETLLAGDTIRRMAVDVAEAMTRPSVLYRPTLTLDGNQWCALYGENLQDGIAGFGSTPAEAMANFDIVWKQG